MKRIIFYSWFGLNICFSYCVQAHHSYGNYDRDSLFSIAGTIIAIEWANPHVILSIQTVDGEDYRVEWRNLIQLTKEGVQQTDIEVGDNVEITGIRNIDPHIYIISLVQKISLPEKEWVWEAEN